jgi:hypothetical protein
VSANNAGSSFLIVRVSITGITDSAVCWRWLDVQEEWRMRREEAGRGGRYSLVEPLLAFSAALAAALGCQSVQTGVMVAVVRAARKAGQLAYAGTEMARLQAMAVGRVAGMEPGSEAEMERLKLLWAEGAQRSLALAQAQRQAAEMFASTAAVKPGVLAKMHGLVGKWLAAERAGSPALILAALKRARDAASAGAEGEKVATR